MALFSGSSSVGKIEYIVDVDTQGLSKGLDDAEKKVNNSEGKLSKGFASITKTVAAATAATAATIAGMTTAAVKGYADYEQLTGGVETLFKNSSSAVMKYADAAYKTAGLSANEYMETVTSFSASLLQGLKGDTEAAAKYADLAVTDMADNANKMGTSMESIQMAYQGFAKDNFTMLDNLKLGYGGTQSEMARLINDTGVMGAGFKATAENVKDIPFDKLIQGIHVVQERMGITGTTAKEASETISGSFNSAKAAFSNFLVALGGGGDTEKAFNELLSSVKVFLKNLLPVVSRTLDNIIKIIGEKMGKAIDEFEKNVPGGEAFTTLAAAIGAVVAAIVVWQTVTTAFTAAQTAFNAVMAANPLGLVALAIIGVVAALTYFFTQTETGKRMFQDFLDFTSGVFSSIGESVSGVMESVGRFFSDARDAVVGAWESIPSFFMNVKKGITDTFSSISRWFGDVFTSAVNAIKGAFSGIGGFFRSVWNTITGIFTNVGTAIGNAIGGSVRGVVNSILGFAENTINGFIRAINIAIGAINKIPGVGIGKLSLLNIPRLATGGVVEPGGRVIYAGDGGEDEWIVPQSKMASLVDKLNSAANTSNGQNITINLSGVFATSPEDQRKVAQQIADQIALINRSRMSLGGVEV